MTIQYIYNAINLGYKAQVLYISNLETNFNKNKKLTLINNEETDELNFDNISMVVAAGFIGDKILEKQIQKFRKNKVKLIFISDRYFEIYKKYKDLDITIILPKHTQKLNKHLDDNIVYVNLLPNFLDKAIVITNYKTFVSKNKELSKLINTNNLNGVFSFGGSCPTEESWDALNTEKILQKQIDEMFNLFDKMNLKSSILVTTHGGRSYTNPLTKEFTTSVSEKLIELIKQKLIEQKLENSVFINVRKADKSSVVLHITQNLVTEYQIANNTNVFHYLLGLANKKPNLLVAGTEEQAGFATEIASMRDDLSKFHYTDFDGVSTEEHKLLRIFIQNNPNISAKKSRKELLKILNEIVE